MQPYNKILRELGIEIINLEKTQKCHLNPVPFKNRGLKIKKLEEISRVIKYITLLRYYHDFYYCIFSKKKEVYT